MLFPDPYGGNGMGVLAVSEFMPVIALWDV
jgi:hypothetical protein